ncbi:hypothetical protein [Bartonella tribocorum]|uniref:Uncharacterized protein n=1 Tax=Bartonella tribocorum TaxID=85701 RepID=A0A2M6UQL2_9HYPH|nr:hypothetical protein [Bartonella tribocorum]PIT68470.1 hypothetical protein CER18_06880 [Bartonella tribocorum]
MKDVKGLCVVGDLWCVGGGMGFVGWYEMGVRRILERTSLVNGEISWGEGDDGRVLCVER